MTTNDHTDHTVPEATSGMVPHDNVAAFLFGWDGVAATLIDRHLTVSGSSELAVALFPNLRLGVNIAREVFLDVLPSREPTCAAEMGDQVVAALHSSLAWHENDPEFQKIIGELSAMSRTFSSAWAAERQQLQPHGILHSTHPVLGELSIKYQLLELAGRWNDVLIVWQGADAASESAMQELLPAL